MIGLWYSGRIMSRSGQLRVSRTKGIPVPNAYVLALQGEFSPWSYDEERAPTLRGRWRPEAFQVAADVALDLEIGTGNGLHFAEHAARHPEDAGRTVEDFNWILRTILRRPTDIDF